MNLIKEYGQIQTSINKLVNSKKPVNPDMFKRQMQILEQLDDKFVKEGHENIQVYTVRIRYNSMLEYLAKKLNLPTDKYVENINLLYRKMGISEE